MYCAIDGDVFDLGRYLHSHPGGAQILYAYAGRDATSLKIDDVSLFHQLTPYTGTDATHLLKTEDPPPALLELLKRDNLVCAKLVSSTRRLITPVEFSRRNHFPSKTERQNSFGARDTNWRVWVAVAEKEGSKKQMVYDVTSRRAQVLRGRGQYVGEKLAGSKRRVGALDDAVLETYGEEIEASWGLEVNMDADGQHLNGGFLLSCV
ncbi:predicted protein [Chaetomium globosum CBS 148.51]|uniref:Cytochrome b5 heme-binding domain-containing protein n=1 Tax=Chaetomium globosum (strain ATCC 6205 / CBS 148.51 / DSM 1962 / NBRC 6347 / NRRL 1970) TaxID=306901 RepID=Q2H1S6_CHAGB|nr:uncharacterized protein CHGG_04270 [Chaetomium globosum CBS 148.51]EAQ87651.1 predicted protein [Chaetomium globosum CBS 148.51]